MDLESMSPVQIDLDMIRERAKLIGKTNQQWNMHAAVIKWCDQLEEMGLTPIVLSDPLTRGTMVTSEQHLSHKFH